MRKHEKMEFQLLDTRGEVDEPIGYGPHNLRRGIVNRIIGATLVFDVTRVTSTFP